MNNTNSAQIDLPSRVLRWAISLPGALVLCALALISVLGKLREISFGNVGAVLWLIALVLYIGAIMGSRWAMKDDGAPTERAKS